VANLAAARAPARLVSRARRATWRLCALVAAAGAAFGLATPADASWREASTAHFVIYSEQNPKALQDFATRLEKFDAAMRYLEKLPDEPLGSANRVTVFVVSGEGFVQKLYGKGAQRNGAAVAGFYIPRAEGSVAFVPRQSGGEGLFDLSAQTVLLHEYSHHFMLQNFPGAYPAWFIEGFAEFNSSASFERDGSVNIGRIAMHRAPQLLRDWPMPVEKLVAIRQARIGSDEGSAIYARGWLLVHYLTMGNGREGQLNDYLRRVARGETSLDAARAAFGELKALDRELSRYMSKPLYYLHLTSDKLGTPAVSIRELGPGENATLPLRIRSTRGVDREEAEELVPAVRAAAARYPNDPAAQNVLAEAEYDAGNFAAAEAAADRAIAGDPKSIHALVYKARAEMAQARTAHDRSDARWQAIRKIIIAANRLDPNDPRPLIWFFRSFLAQGVRPNANAAIGLEQALALAPQDTGLRMTVAHRLLTDGKGKEARATLAPIAFSPHGGEAAELAAKIIAALDAGGTTQAALAIWKQPSDEDDDEGGSPKKGG
jgi:tetratricopeptide (TPR) repeat protein